MKKIAFLIITLLLAACANTDEALRRESAIQIGGKVNPDALELQAVDRGVVSVHWRAVTPTGEVYKCSGDDMLKRVTCSPVSAAEVLRGAVGIK